MGYVPLEERGFRLSMALRPLDLAQWLEIDDGTSAQRAQKDLLFAQRYDDVVALTAGSEDACEELYDEVTGNLQTVHGLQVPAGREGDHPLVAASRLVSEDLCVLVRGDTEWSLRAACVCFPSRWPLREKINATLDEIHAPVPGYDTTLASPTANFFDRLRPERSFWRLNWTLLDDEELFQPEPSIAESSRDVGSWFFRVERQTLRRLPRSGAVVFTIRTYVTSAREMAAREASFARDVYRTLLTAPADTLAYKGWRGLSAQWLLWFPNADEPRTDTPPH